MKKLNALLIAIALIVVTGCSSIPLSTMVKLMNLNPLEADPNQIVVAVKSPGEVDVRDGDVVIDFSFRTGNPDTSFSYSYPVIVDSSYVVPVTLKSELEKDEQFTVMRLSEKDAQLMKQGQEAVRKYRSTHEEGGAGSINVRLLSACQSDELTWGNSELDVYLKIDQTDEFLLFLEDIDLSELDINKNC